MISEEFAIILSPGEVVDDYSIPPDLAQDIINKLSELEVRPEQMHLETGSAGYNADAITVIAIITGVFMLGKKIEENLAAWQNIGRRLTSVLDRLKQSYHGVSVSEPGALAIAVHMLEEQADLNEGIHLVSASILPVNNRSLGKDWAYNFRAHPDRFYLFVLRDSKQDTFVVCMRSSGHLEFLRRLPSGDWLEYFGYNE